MDIDFTLSEGLSVWWNKSCKHLHIMSFRKIRKQNRKEYGTSDPDINIKRQWGIRTNGARKGIDSCLDWTLSLGHIEINYVDFEYNKKKPAR